MNGQQAFDRLAPFVRAFVYQQGWQELRDLQVEAIAAILDGAGDVLITTGTASGKTEAAFLPILSRLAQEPAAGVQAVYVGPLKALINDQFRRLEPLCEQGGIAVHRWHGDVGAGQKSDLLERPGGVLQITPESIESLLINQSGSLRRLFGGLRFIVIDEVHSFLESDRGVQLRSQMERLSAYAARRPRRVGLSATVGDVAAACAWLGGKVRVISPPVATPPIRLSHMHFVVDGGDLPETLLQDLYVLTRNRKTLIFCNSRRHVEQITTQLNQRCRREQLAERYLPHHGSISKEQREEAEECMRSDDRPHSVVCTNTLEMGIDIGQLELTAQVDSTHSVMSFVQRLGRTGRKAGAARCMQIYTSETPGDPDGVFYRRLPFSLLKALAVVDLFAAGWAEPPLAQVRPYHVLYQQLLSRLIETNGAAPDRLVADFFRSPAFAGIEPDDYAVLLRHLAAGDQIEQLATGELIVGLAGEQVARRRDFYAVFATPPEWSVLCAGRIVGRISPAADLTVGHSLLLSGQVWRVCDLLAEQRQVLVQPGGDARKVMFAGGGAPEMHDGVARRVLALLGESRVPDYLDESAAARLTASRRLFAALGLDACRVVAGEEEWTLLPWVGTRTARTLQLLLRHAGYEAAFPTGLFPWVLNVSRQHSEQTWPELLDELGEMAARLPDGAALLQDVPETLLRSHKFDEYLPLDLVRKRAAGEWIDWPGLLACLPHLH